MDGTGPRNQEECLNVSGEVGGGQVRAGLGLGFLVLVDFQGSMRLLSASSGQL